LDQCVCKCGGCTRAAKHDSEFHFPFIPLPRRILHATDKRLTNGFKTLF